MATFKMRTKLTKKGKNEMKARKFLASLLAIAMMLSTMGFTAFADAAAWDGTSTDTAWYGDGTATEFTISDAADLAGLAKLVNEGNSFSGKTVKLGADIDLAGETWAGIGVYNETAVGTAFSGTFDGNGKKISNVTFTDDKYHGFFNQLYNATVKNLTVEVDGFVGSAEKYGGAAIAGHAISSTIESCVSEGAITGTHNVAGIAVRVEGSTIKNCTNKAALTTSYTKLGGIVSFTQYNVAGQPNKVSVIEGCVNEGAVTSTGDTSSDTSGVGGIIGWIGYTGNPTYDNDSAYHIEIKNCENKASVTGTENGNIGQIVGCAHDHTEVYGTNKGLATTFGIGANNNYFNFATVVDGVATYVTALTAGKTYLVTAPNAKPVIKLADGESITFDTTLSVIDDSGITADKEITKTVNGKMIIYSVGAPAIDNFKADLLASRDADGNYVFDGKGKTYQWTIGNTVNKGDANAPSRYNSKNAQYYLLNGETGSVTLKNVNFVFIAPEGTVTGNIIGANSVVNAAQLYFENTGDFTVENCSFDNVVLTNFEGEGTAKVTDCTFTNITDSYAIKDIRGKNITVSNNTFTNCSGAIMVSAVNADFAVESVNVAGNNFTSIGSGEGIKDRGIVQLAATGVYADDAVSYESNTATDCGSTFRLLNTSAMSDVLTLVENSNGALTTTDDSLAPVAKIGDTEYTSLQAAINAASATDTITLLGNVSEKGKEVEAGSGEFFVQILDKEVTIDLAGFTFSGSLYLNSAAKLAIDNGNIISLDGNMSSCIESVGGAITLGDKLSAHSSTRHCIRVKGGTAVINGGTYKASGNSTYHVVNVSHASNVTINNGTFIGNKGYSTAGGNALMVQDAASTVNIYGGDFSNASGPEGCICAAAGLTIYGGTFDTWTYDSYLAEDCWAFQNFNEKNIFHVAEKKDAPQAIIEKIDNPTIDLTKDSYGNADTTGLSEITLESAYKFTAPDTADTANASQYATWHADFVVSVDKDIPAKSIILSGNYGSWGWISFTNEEAISAGTEIRLLNLFGGYMSYYELCRDVIEFQCGVADIDGALDGVNFTVELNMYQTEPYTDKNNTKNNEVVGATPIVSNAVTYEIGSSEKIAQIGEVTYPTLEAAIEAANTGDEIVLLNDITVAETKTSGYTFVVGPTKDITLNLNGHNIKSTINGTANCGLINVQGKLNVTGTGKIELTNTDNSTSYAFTSAVIGLNNHDGYTVDTSLSLGEGVQVVHNGGTSMAYAVDMMTYTGCSVTVNGATLESTYTAVRLFGNNANKDLVINSGTIEGGSRGVWVHHTGKSDTSVTMNGGTITSESGRGIHVSTAAASTESVQIALNGGTISAASPLTLALADDAINALDVTKAEAMTVTAPEGYVWEDNKLVEKVTPVLDTRIYQIPYKEGEIPYVAVFAGIDSLNYSAVGFDATLNGDTKTFTTNTVYDSITVNDRNDGNTTLTANQFGEDCNYIFAYKIYAAGVDAGTALLIKPFAVTVDGETITGEECTVYLGAWPAS